MGNHCFHNCALCCFNSELFTLFWVILYKSTWKSEVIFVLSGYWIVFSLQNLCISTFWNVYFNLFVLSPFLVLVSCFWVNFRFVLLIIFGLSLQFRWDSLHKKLYIESLLANTWPVFIYIHIFCKKVKTYIKILIILLI
jgi:hypothetical protein